MLRSSQFPEDAGPLAHPIRPDSYIEINNFYTMTVYEKGAEIVRMIRSLIGEAGFRRGMDLYVERHDGTAATCDDFVAAMADANHIDLSHFQRWYGQAGTPCLLTVSMDHDPASETVTLNVSQLTPATPGQPDKKAGHHPVGDRLDRSPRPRGTDGGDRWCCRRYVRDDGGHADYGGESKRLLSNVPEMPVPSLLRGFSAPIDSQGRPG